MLACWPPWCFFFPPLGAAHAPWNAAGTHRVEIGEEPHTVGWGGLHGELQEGFHVQVGLDHRGGPQKGGDGPRPVDASCEHIERGREKA